MNGNAWAEEEIARLREMCEKRYTQRQAAAELGRSLNSVACECSLLKIKFHSQGLTEEERQVAARLYCETDMNYSDIARKMGYNPATIRSTLQKKMGLRRVPKPKIWTETVQRKLEDMMAAGVDLQTAAAELGLKESSVVNRVRFLFDADYTTAAAIIREERKADGR